MKKLRWVFMGLFLLSTFVFSESNQSISNNAMIELEVVSKLSEFMGTALTGFTGQISNLLIFFMAILTIISVLGYFKMNKLSTSIQGNRELIGEKFEDYKREMKIEIKEEVMQQVVYGLDKALDKAQEHTYRKVEYTVDKLTEEIQRRRFFYQGLIYQLNQAKKYEYEEVMREEVKLDEKIDKIIKIQAKYNEINNHDIPKLFSKNIEQDVVPIAKKISEYKNIKHTIQKLLVKVLERDNLNFVQKTQIKDILKEKYDWEEEKGAE